ncbi:MAG TPA: SAM-dependent methyltransferase [Acidimicrobiales bacterium]|nr:SAM-dependent methyltransferase [Acidimicrobiales bacterium]
MARKYRVKHPYLGDAGLLRFDQFVELALYDPAAGFYSRAGGPSHRRDFLTSPGVGALFGAVLARALDTWWRDLGAPEPFHVIEAGAGDGSLAGAIRRARPECLPALRYTAVERSDALRRRHPPGVTSLAEMPAGAHDGIVLANELLDNIPFRLLERTSAGWDEVHVDHDRREVLVSAIPGVASEADLYAPDAPPGARIPFQQQAVDWMSAAISTLSRGRAVVIDYCDTTPNLATRPWTEWVRTYRANGPGTAPLEDLGQQDITCEVAVDQLVEAAGAPTHNRSQAEFLRAHGIEELADRAREQWLARAHVGDFEALRHKSRLTEAAALTDSAGLGAFRVLEWIVSPP